MTNREESSHKARDKEQSSLIKTNGESSIKVIKGKSIPISLHAHIRLDQAHFKLSIVYKARNPTRSEILLLLLAQKDIKQRNTDVTMVVGWALANAVRKSIQVGNDVSVHQMALSITKAHQMWKFTHFSPAGLYAH